MEYSAAQLSYLQHLDIDVWVTRAANEPLSVSSTVKPESASGHMSALAGIIDEKPVAVAEPLMAQAQQPSVNVQPAREHSVIPTEPQASVQEKPAAFGALKAPSFPKAQASFEGTKETIQGDNPPLDVPHYTLQFWCYSSGLWLVSAETQLSPSHHTLAHNIAQFVHGKKRKPRHVGIFSWPMLAAPNIDQSAVVAQKYLAQHVMQLSGLVECKKLLVFDEVSDILSQHSAIQMPVSLNQLLATPLLKKQLWQFLLTHQIES